MRVRDLQLCPELGVVGFRLAEETVLLEHQDWLRLAALPRDTVLTVGTSGGWRVPVVVHASWGNAVLARLVVGASGSEQVQYRSQDRFDLTRANLRKVPRRGRFRRGRPEPVLPAVEDVLERG